MTPLLGLQGVSNPGPRQYGARAELGQTRIEEGDAAGSTIVVRLQGRTLLLDGGLVDVRRWGVQSAAKRTLCGRAPCSKQHLASTTSRSRNMGYRMEQRV